MPIRNQIEAVVNQLSARPGLPKFLYGTVNELNTLADDTDFPCVFMYPLQPIDKGFTLSNAIDSKFSIYLEFLYKTEFDQYTSDNETYIIMADSMINEFMVKLANYRESEFESRYFKIHENDKAKAIPVYNKFDVNSTGMSLAITLDTMNNENIVLT